MLNHDHVAVIYSKLSEASGQVEPVEMPLTTLEEVETTQRFIAALCQATGVWYDTTMNRDNISLIIKARR